MRRQWQIGVVAAITLVGVATLRAGVEDDAKARQVMADARKALGGESTLASLKGLSMRVEFRREMAAPFMGGGGTFVIMSGGGGRADMGGQTTGSTRWDTSSG